MSAEETKQPSQIEQLVSKLKEVVSSNEPTEADFAALGETLLTAVKGALGTS